VLALALALLIGVHIGSNAATAQPGMVTGVVPNFDNTGNFRMAVLSLDGTVYVNRLQHDGMNFIFIDPAEPVGNFWTGMSTVPTTPSSMGNVKSQYRDD